MVQAPAAVFESVVGVFYERFILTRLLLVLVNGRGKEVDQKGNATRNGSKVSPSKTDGEQNGRIAGPEMPAGTSTSADIATTAPNETNAQGTSVTDTSEWKMERERQEGQSQAKRKMAVLFWSATFCRTIGYIWVFCWFCMTGRWFIRPYIDVGMTEWSTPFSLADWLIVPDNC